MPEEHAKTLIDEALEQLWIVPQVTFALRAKRFIRKNLLGQLLEPIDYIPWPKGCLLVGLVHAGRKKEASEYFDLWIEKGSELYTVDDLLAGQALLQLDGYAMSEHAMMGFLYAHAKDAQGSLPYRPLHKTGHIYADGIGMICPFAVGYGVKYHDGEAVKLAMRQFRNFMKNGMDKMTGLPYHAYRYHADAPPEQLGAVGWGRAVGWIFYGMGMSLYFFEQNPALYKKERAELARMAQEFARTVFCYRNEEGLFSSFFCDRGSPTDTSASAMILHGLCMVSKEPYRTECGRIWEALQKYCVDGKVLQAQSECISLGTYGEQYDSFPWSVGMTLSLAARLYF